MKELKLIQKIAVAAGLCYALWLGGRVDATGWDSRNAIVILVLVVVILLSLLWMKSKQPQE